MLGVFGGLVDKFPMGRSAQQHGHRCIPVLLERMARGELKTSHLMTYPTVQEQEGGLRPGGGPAGG